MSSPPTTASPGLAPAGSPALDDPTDHTRAFFDALLDDAPNDHYALLWTMPGKHSTWVPLRYGVDGGPDAITEQAQALSAAGKDVYVAVSVAPQPGLHDTRIESANSAGIFGLWADIDIADPDAHKKWNLPPDVDSALALLEAAQLAPTMVIHSGHGLQAWWLFNEFWAFDTEDKRLEAAGLAQRWNTTLRAVAGERGWIIDSTFDLARVMRVPGTVNRKADPHMPVRVLTLGGPRYEPADIEPFCRDENYLPNRGITPARHYKLEQTIVLSEGNSIDFELLQALLDNHETFKTTWDMKRTARDFPDQSPSSYDLSLATLAAGASWTDQQIANLLYAFRKRHKLDAAKALRRDYIERTIGRARAGLARDESAEAIEDVIDALEEATISGDPEEQRETRRAAVDVVSGQTEVEWVHFIKYMSEPPAYAGVTVTKTVQLGNADGFLAYQKFRQSVVEGVDVLIPRFKSSEWDNICRLIIRSLEEQDVGSEATERGEMAAWLAAYLAQRPPVDTQEEAESSEYPYLIGEGDSTRVVMFGPAFKRWLYLTYQERITNVALGRKLRAFGCEPDKVNVESKSTGKRTSRGVWRLPVGMGV